ASPFDDARLLRVAAASSRGLPAGPGALIAHHRPTGISRAFAGLLGCSPRAVIRIARCDETRSHDGDHGTVLPSHSQNDQSIQRSPSREKPSAGTDPVLSRNSSQRDSRTIAAPFGAW